MTQNAFVITFAQQDFPSVTPGGETVPSTTTNSAIGGESTAAPGGLPATATQTSTSPNPMMLIMLLVVAMLVFTMWSSRRDRKKREALIGAVKKHDRVQTIGGVIGSVVEVKPEYIILKVDESSNTRITFARSAVQQVLTSSSEPNGGTTD